MRELEEFCGRTRADWWYTFAVAVVAALAGVGLVVVLDVVLGVLAGLGVLDGGR